MESSVTEFVQKNVSQSHLCICNNRLFDDTVVNGIYGFPHAGKSRTKSFWRAVASMYNIGPNDLIFLYRTNGNRPGCQEIHGPFTIHTENHKPVICYDLESPDFPMKVEGTTDCQVRFLFKKTTADVYSMSDKYELIKKYETKEIWGYRHPAVMNIGAARKKSVTSFTSKQTLCILSLIKECSEIRFKALGNIPSTERIHYYHSLSNDYYHYALDDDFLLSANTTDEAFLYAYILRGLRTPSSILHNEVIKDFSLINDEMLNVSCNKHFIDMTANALMETIISPHLQEELDIVLMDKEDSMILFFEVKSNLITQVDIYQTQKYIDLLRVIFPERSVCANVIGSGKDSGVTVNPEFERLIKLVSYDKDANGVVRFSSI